MSDASMNIKPFDGKIDFSMWQIKMKSILIKEKCWKAVNPATAASATTNVKKKGILIEEHTPMKNDPGSDKVDVPEDLHRPNVSRDSLLYDFEELEGELDFLTRMVVLTFYPFVLGKTPITLGEVELRGVSVPWKSMFTCEEPASSILEQAIRKNKSNPFMHDLDTNLHPPHSLTEDVPSPLQRNNPSNWKGDGLISSVDAVDTGSSQSQHVELQPSGTRQYISLIKSFMELQTILLNTLSQVRCVLIVFIVVFNLQNDPLIQRASYKIITSFRQ